MNRDKSSQGRRDSRHNNARNSNDTMNEQDSESSVDNDSPEQPKSASTIALRRNRTTSGSSVKSSRRRSISKPTDDSDNEIVPSDATYSKYDSGSNQNNSEVPVVSVGKFEDFLMNDYTRNNEKSESDSSDINPVTRREKRRKSKKQRSEKNRTLNTDRTGDEEDGPSSERDLSRPRMKKTRANISHKSRRRRRRSKEDSSGKTERQEKELPITEILRKAQENPRPRYEEPAPLAELTADRIYVQGRRNGFSAVKISTEPSAGIFGRRRSQSREPATPLYPIKVAIAEQKIWNSTGFIHQGLLAGMALMHLLLIQNFFQFSLDFIINYSLVSEYYTNIFSFLITMCVISAFDRYDLAQVDIEHLREIYVEHSRSFLAIPLYIATFCLHQTSLLVDDNIALLGYSRNTTLIDKNYTGFVVEEDLGTWQKVTLAKDGLAVLAWLFVALGPREDMLLTHLKAMEKYAEPPETSG